MFNKTSDTASTPDSLDVEPAQAVTSSVEEPLLESVAPEQSAEANWEEKYYQMQDQFTRLAADFENYRKRVREEQQALVKYGAEKAVLEMLPILDNLDRAFKSLTENSDAKTLFQSFEVMSRQLMGSLEALGVKRIEAVGQAFDPQFHEAVSRMVSADHPEESVLHEAQTGYLLHDKVLRPAQVVVAVGPEPDAVAAGPDTPGKVHNPFQTPSS